MRPPPSALARRSRDANSVSHPFGAHTSISTARSEISPSLLAPRACRLERTDYDRGSDDIFGILATLNAPVSLVAFNEDGCASKTIETPRLSCSLVDGSPAGSVPPAHTAVTSSVGLDDDDIFGVLAALNSAASPSTSPADAAGGSTDSVIPRSYSQQFLRGTRSVVAAAGLPVQSSSLRAPIMLGAPHRSLCSEIVAHARIRGSEALKHEAARRSGRQSNDSTSRSESRRR